jgi:hypothetical protein
VRAGAALHSAQHGQGLRGTGGSSEDQGGHAGGRSDIHLVVFCGVIFRFSFRSSCVEALLQARFVAVYASLPAAE